MDTLTPVEVAPRVYRLGSKVVNWYLVEDGGRLTAVDAGLPGFGAHLEADLRTLGRRVEDVHAVVLTHSDSDHTGLVPKLREAGARVMIHEADEQTLREPAPKGGDGRPARMAALMWRPRFWRFMGHMARGGGGHPARIDGARTLADGEILDVPGSPRVVHTPGHTAGHSALLLEDRGVLFVGDALCTVNPLTGRSGPRVMPFGNLSDDTSLASLAAIEGLEAGVLLPGHGQPWHGGPGAAVARAREVARG